jgi:hypothetical protein
MPTLSSTPSSSDSLRWLTGTRPGTFEAEVEAVVSVPSKTTEGTTAGASDLRLLATGPVDILGRGPRRALVFAPANTHVR